MLEFSASKSSRGKVAYKNYERMQCASMAELGALTRNHSLCSFFFGSGVTEGGEECEGHRAWRSVIGDEGGNVLFFDFDDRGATHEMLVQAIERVGAHAWLGPSKSWVPDGSVQKYHLAVEIDQMLPLDKELFERMHAAVAQWLGVGGLDDPAMRGATQQMAPHWHQEAECERVFEGAALDMGDVLAAYREPEEGERKGGGEVENRTVELGSVQFVVSATGEIVSLEDMLPRVRGETRIRVHCLSGLIHDGREDTALVRGSVDGHSLIYHCTGGRCGHTIRMSLPPFEAEAGGGEESEEVGGGPAWTVETRHVDDDDIAAIIAGDPYHGRVYSEPRVMDAMREAALAWGLVQILDRTRIIEGCIREWNGRFWEEKFPGETDLFRFVVDMANRAGFSGIAHIQSRMNAVATYITRNLPTVSPQDVKGGDVLNLNNCMLVVGQGAIPHDPEYYFTSVLPFDYIEGAAAPTWEAVIDKIMLGNPELVRALQDALGYLMLRDFNRELVICFEGDGANGKTTVQKVLKMLLGRDGYSSQPLHVLTKVGGEGAYARAMMSGRLVNFTNELQPKAIASDGFKDLISGEDITARWPYGRPFELARVPKQLCSMNTVQGLVRENTHGFMRRLWIIPFRYTVTEAEKDFELDRKLRAELPGILNWVMAGARRVMQTRRLTQAAVMASGMERLALDANPIRQFIEEFYEPYEQPLEQVRGSVLLGRLIKGSVLFERYSRFCLDNNYPREGRNNFYREVTRLGFSNVDKAVKVNREVVKAGGWYMRNKNAEQDPTDVEDKLSNVVSLVTKKEGYRNPD